METVIFKWNPNFSSYSMFHYLYDIVDINNSNDPKYNWSVWDYEKIHEGDRFYWMKLGYGTIGICGRGTITSEPYADEDWSGKGRTTYYVDFDPELLINPDALPILDLETLKANIPDFDWDHGHSGLALTSEQAEKLDQLWDAFVAKNRDEFEKKNAVERPDKDYLYWD